MALATAYLAEPGAPWDGELAFERVALFPAERFEEALAALLETASFRVALIIPVVYGRQTRREGSLLKTLRSLEFVVIAADRVVGDFDAAAAFSDTAITNPGSMGLCDAVAQILDGQDLGIPRVALEPGDAQPLSVSSTAGNGRSAMAMTYRTSLGAQAAPITRPTGRPAQLTYANSVPPLANEDGQIILDTTGQVITNQ